MNWLTNYVLPKIRALTRKEVPDNLWRKCPSCEQMLFHRELAANLEVCRHCGHHFRIGSEARFKILFDDGAKHEPTDAAETVDADACCHCSVLLSHPNWGLTWHC